MSFIGKRILVTGGAQGLGRATVEKFNTDGGKVFAIDKDSSALEILKADLPDVTTICVDLLNWEATSIELEKYGPFDHLVNNAGVYRVENFFETKESDVDFIFGVNFKAVLNVSKIFSNRVIENGIIGASIVNVSSVTEKRVIPSHLIYACSKSAVTMLTKCLAQELGPHGIRVNSICPTAMITNILNHDPLTSRNEFEAMCLAVVADSAIPRILDTSEAADLILYLCSSKAAMITGQDVAIDGGFRL